MARRTRGKGDFTLPLVVPGEWQGEIYSGGSVNLGQVVQSGPPRQSVEFSYMVIPASLLMPSPKFRWPGIVGIMAPTPMKTEYTDAGSLFANSGLPSLSLSFNVTREQFSDVLRLVETQRFKEFHFTVEDAERENAWPVRSWGMATRLN
ncbi:hypothetical protein [Brucella tritici]|uniref:Uncharacterized protein n=1 Tax=Brucella tritici TaxID=94626 RepID=A0A6L3YV16_9HYPH|nr:hypothetical protein [Brucella tritici]KAB2688935.1 hypothetical protein F9L08_04565 [Brucella tritici]